MFPTPRTQKLLGFGQLWSRGFHSCLQILIIVLTTKVTALVPREKICRHLRVNPCVPIRSIWTVFYLTHLGWSKNRFEIGNEELSVNRIDGCSQISLRLRLWWPENCFSGIWSAQPICPLGPALDPCHATTCPTVHPNTIHHALGAVLCIYKLWGCLGRFGGV